MSLLSVVVYVPYVFWILWLFASQLNEKYTWASVHGPHWNTVIKVPSYGQVRLDKWGQVATGYLAFAVFGTGTDANNTYKRMLCAIGLGRIFPSLYQLSDSGASTPSSFQIGQQWCSACTSKARSFFSKSRTEDRTLQSTIACSRRNSVTEETPVGNTPGSTSFQPVGSRDPILAQQQQQRQPQASPARQPFFRRLLSRRRSQETVLPLFVKKVSPDSTEMEKSPTGTVPSGVYSHVWAPESSSAARHSVSEGVTIITEVHQNDNVRPDQTQKDAAA
jgi:pheromone a factor receptor